MPNQQDSNTPSVTAISQGRLFFVDALRVAAVAFVIAHHAAQAYGPTGGFWPVHDQAQNDWFGPFYTANAAFGLGLLFLISGYFTAASLDRKGPRRFLRERWVRIGIPLVGFVMLVHAPAAYVFGARPADEGFIGWLYQRSWVPVYLHLWFLGHLMLYTAVLVGWRQLVPSLDRTERNWSVPSSAVIAGFIAALGLITWIVRIRYPVDAWVPFLWIMPAEPAHLPQYVALFAAGAIAHGGNWFLNMPRSAGLMWLG